MHALRMDDDDWIIWVAVVEAAQKFRQEEEIAKIRAMARGIGSEVANEVGKIIAAMFR